MMRRKLLNVLVVILFCVLLALYVIGQRSFRDMITLFVFIILILICAFLKKGRLVKITGFILSFAFAFTLYVCTAPGLLEPVFWKLEKAKFSVVKPFYEEDVDLIKSALSKSENNYSGKLFRIEENNLPILVSSVEVRKEEELAIFYVTEWHRSCGYIWISDPDCLEWLDYFNKVTPAGDNWYYVQEFPIRPETN